MTGKNMTAVAMTKKSIKWNDELKMREMIRNGHSLDDIVGAFPQYDEFELYKTIGSSMSSKPPEMQKERKLRMGKLMIDIFNREGMETYEELCRYTGFTRTTAHIYMKNAVEKGMAEMPEALTDLRRKAQARRFGHDGDVNAEVVWREYMGYDEKGQWNEQSQMSKKEIMKKHNISLEKVNMLISAHSAKLMSEAKTRRREKRK